MKKVNRIWLEAARIAGDNYRYRRVRGKGADRARTNTRH